jgi:hypothetical protein
MLVHRAGPTGVAVKPATTFRPIAPLEDVAGAAHDYRQEHRPGLLERALAGVVDALQR